MIARVSGAQPGHLGFAASGQAVPENLSCRSHAGRGKISGVCDVIGVGHELVGRREDKAILVSFLQMLWMCTSRLLARYGTPRTI
jgi:hypothetical protein